ncbi:MAG: Fic family protein [Chloroflexales bacterium]|nr:Fic family protein [Chloroflexales bacterium]
MMYLSAYDLLTIHGALLHEFGGMPGVTEAGFGRLEVAVAAPQQSMFGEDLFPDLPSKAAALAHAIMRNHPFSDGNKRVALVALDVMLTINGAALRATSDEAYALAMAAACGIEREEMVAWVRSHTTV